MANFLEEMHPHHGVGFYHMVGPKNIPISPFITILNVPPKFLSHISNDLISRHYSYTQLLLDKLMMISFDLGFTFLLDTCQVGTYKGPLFLGLFYFYSSLPEDSSEWPSFIFRRIIISFTYSFLLNKNIISYTLCFIF